MSKQDLIDHVKRIADAISDPEEHLETNEEGEPYTAFDYLEDVFHIEYIIGSDRQYRGARVLVAFGGPNIWIDTKKKLVEGYWWNDHASWSFEDSLGLDDALEEIYNCS